MNHLLDVTKFLEDLWTECSPFINTEENETIPISDEMIFEQLLFLIQKWSTGITKTVLLQDLLAKTKKMRSQGKVKPESVGSPVLHALIDKIDINPKNVPVCIELRQIGSDNTIISAFHGAFCNLYSKYPFLFCQNRRIHIANLNFPTDQLLSTQICVIDLNEDHRDISFIQAEAEGNSFSKITPGEISGLVVRVLDDNSNSILLTDDSVTTPIPFIFNNESEKQLKLLFHYSDVLLIYKPLFFVDDIQKGFLIGPNTAFFRIPYTDPSQVSQITQVSQTSQYLTQDGLHVRNSTMCRSLIGTIISIKNTYIDNIIINTFIEVLDRIGEVKIISVPKDKCSYSMHRMIQQMRPGHFVFIFGLKQAKTHHSDFSSTMNEQLFFNMETTLFNTSLMSGFEASGFINPAPLASCDFYTTYVAKASIVSLQYHIKEIHSECGNCLVQGVCSRCNGSLIPEKLRKKTVVLIIKIDDGSCDHVEVMAMQSCFPMWGITADELIKANNQSAKSIIGRLVGEEFIFVMSKGSSKEFGEMQDSQIIRIDQALQPVGETERNVKRLIDFHKKLDM